MSSGGQIFHQYNIYIVLIFPTDNFVALGTAHMYVKKVMNVYKQYLWAKKQQCLYTAQNIHNTSR